MLWLGVRPLHYACSLAHIQIIDYLIEKGAEINCVDFSGKCPLYEAIISKYDREDVVTKLLELKANLTFLDQEQNNLLHVAMINHKFNLAALLIDYFPEINVMNCFNETALQLAANKAPAELIETLLNRGADPKLKDSDGNTILHRAVTFNTLTTVEVLLKKDQSDVNAVNGNNENALFLALKRVGSSAFVKTLIQYVANLNIKNSAGRTAMEILMETPQSAIE